MINTAKPTALYNNSFDVDFEEEGEAAAVMLLPRFLIMQTSAGLLPQLMRVNKPTTDSDTLSEFRHIPQMPHGQDL